VTQQRRRPVRLARPFAITGGRTRSEAQLDVEDLVVTSLLGVDQTTVLRDEKHTITVLCLRPRSVAEVAALVGVPLGVARVLIGDLVAAGLADVQGSAVGGVDDGAPESMSLLERLHDGLRAL
jgi:hypothetical protein